ncbi:TRAF-type zinc finger domain-containing protein 1-like protein [Tanacetum coccineum]
MTDNVGKKVICYNCRGEGHVSRQCKEKKRVKDSQYFKDKMLLMEAKEKGTVLDAEAEAFLADDAYDSDVDEGPHAAAAFMANLSSTSGTNGATTSQVNEVHTDANQIFDNVNHLLTHEMHQEEHLDSDVESDIDDNTIPYHQYQLDSDVQDVPTEVSSAPPGEISMITILDDLRTQLDGHLKVNQEQSLVNDSLRAELARCKQEMVSLERNKVKHDLDQTIIQRNKRNAELEEENVLLKSKLSQNVVSINSLKNESKKVVSENKALKDKYLEEISTFVPQKELSRELVYWLPAEQLDTQISNPPKPLKDQLQGKDDTIRNLQTQINITRMLNVGSTVGSFDKQALETELTQLKDALTSVRIQIDRYKAENVNLKRRYEELSKSNAYSRSTFTAKINALTAENAKLKTELSSKKSSGSTASAKTQILASWYVYNSSKTKPATESRKPMPKSHTQNHRILPSKSVNARRAADHNRELKLSTSENDSSYKYLYEFDESHEALHIFRDIFKTSSEHSDLNFHLEIRESELTAPEQTATGKEISNPFLADSLLKTIRFEDIKKAKLMKLLHLRNQSLLQNIKDLKN